MTLRLALALAIAAAATGAVAQPAGPPPRPGEAPSAEMKARHEALKKQHLEDLRTVLRLRPDQEPALAAFAASHEPKRFEMKLPEPGATTPQRLEAMGRHEAEMRAQHEQMRQALSKFYAALSPEQQTVFDALQRLKGPGGPGPLMMSHGPDGPGGRT
ncbi:MAG: Spy/CpxP family protein refolding chaperone [Pseudomonadota bacterium]